jgi:hypothetical protein
MQLRHNEQHIEHMFQTEIPAGIINIRSHFGAKDSFEC